MQLTKQAKYKKDLLFPCKKQVNVRIGGTQAAGKPAPWVPPTDHNTIVAVWTGASLAPISLLDQLVQSCAIPPMHAGFRGKLASRLDHLPITVGHFH